MRVIAHRGFGDEYPENTVYAARESARRADCVELDVRRCGSGELVISHFQRLFWTTDDFARVNQRSAAELESLGVDGSSYGVPRLDDALDVIPPDVCVELDLKEPGVVEDVLALTDEIPNDVVLTSFYSDVLWEAQSMDESVTLAYNFDVRVERNLTTARLLDCGRVNAHWSLCLGTDLVERAREEGITVYAWPVRWRGVAFALGAAGIEGLVASHPGVAEWAKRGRRLRGGE
ncbi:glycerophosphodiester phosphodiesterase [Halopelagius fulvigenes]|uniref:Glycerophosphodiester phosphodiesterase n=1 Tax=Halopelagius fulvigenes TaxID=1198324 RepID=A0ABD5U252_9EURY